MSEILNLQFSIFNKLKSFWKKPKVVIVTGNGRKTAFEAISHLLKKYFEVNKNILVFETNLKDPQEFRKLQILAKKSELPTLVITHIGEIPTDKLSFNGSETEISEIRDFLKIFSQFKRRYLVLNFDDDTVRNFKKENPVNSLTFGFQEGADFMCSDIKMNGGTNFKINYDGKTVPFWIEKALAKEQIYSILSAAAVGTILNLNLVEISETLKNWGVDTCNKIA